MTLIIIAIYYNKSSIPKIYAAIHKSMHNENTLSKVELNLKKGQEFLIEQSHSNFDFKKIYELDKNREDYGLIVNCHNPPSFIEAQSHFGLLRFNRGDYRSRTVLGAYKNRNNYMSGKRRLSFIEYAVFQNDPTFEIDESSTTSVQYPNNVYVPMFSPGGVFRYGMYF